MTKRIIALLLALILTVGLLPTVALAAEGNPTPDGGSTGTISGGTVQVAGNPKQSVEHEAADDPIHIKKSVSKDADGKDYLTMEAYVTNPLEIKQEAVPIDIVLVLDVSGSMDKSLRDDTVPDFERYPNDMTNSDYLYYEQTGYGVYSAENVDTKISVTATDNYERVTRLTYSELEGSGYNVSYYAKGSDRKYHSLKIVSYVFNSYLYIDNQIKHKVSDWNAQIQLPGYEIYKVDSNKTTYTYTDIKTGKEILTSTGPNNSPTNNGQVVTFYYYNGETQKKVYKINALKEAANNFIAKVAEQELSADADGNAQYNRISIVKFASDKPNPTNKEGNGFTNDTEYNYSQIVKNLTNVDEAGKAGLTNAVNALTPKGATRADYGMEQAEYVLNNRQDKTRPSVVIMFTDGSPTSSNGFEASVASAAVTAAKALKDAGTFVYTIAVEKDANPGAPIEGNKAKDINKYLHAVSSNYPNATANSNGNKFNVTFGNRVSSEKNYYFNATNAIGLNNVFETISREVSNLALVVDSTAVLSDTLSGYFSFDVDDATKAGITVKRVPVTGGNATDGFTWADIDDATKVTDLGTSGVEIKGKSIEVKNFNYGSEENAVTVYADGRVTGAKLVITFPIKPDDSATWTEGTVNYPTNSTTSPNEAGLRNYALKSDKNNKNQQTQLTESPEIQIKAHTVSYEVAGNGNTGYTVPTSKVYREGQSYTIEDRLPDSNGYKFTGWCKDDKTCTSNPTTDPQTMGTANVTYYGKWENATATVDLASYVKKTLTGNLPTGYKESFTAKITGTGITGEGLTITTDEFQTAGTKLFKGTNDTKVDLTIDTEYVYTVTEVVPNPTTPGMTYGAAVKFALKATDATTIEFYTVNADGTKTKVDAAADQYVTITNAYNPTSVGLNLVECFQKHLTSNTANVPDAGKTFTLTITGTSNNITDKTAITGTATVGTLTESGTSYGGSAYFTFKKGAEDVSALNFTAAGSYTYKVQETAGSTLGMSYDTNEYILTVEVADENNDGALEIKSAVVTKDGQTVGNVANNVFTITNTFTAAELPLDPPKDKDGKVTGEGKVVKVMDGEDREGSMTFTAKMTGGGFTGTKTATATVAANADRASFDGFGTLVFTKAGTYTYEIKEEAGSTVGVSYDGHTYTLTVEVTADGDELKITSATYTDGDTITTGENLPVIITNRYTKPAYTVEKIVITEEKDNHTGWELDYPDAPKNGKIVVDADTDTIRLGYVIKITGQAGAKFTLEEDADGEFVTTGLPEDVTATSTKEISISLSKDYTADDPLLIYAVKEISRDTTTKAFPAKVKNTVTEEDETPHESGETTIEERGTLTVDFGALVHKHLTVTGDKSFNGATFTVNFTDGTFIKNGKENEPEISSIEVYVADAGVNERDLPDLTASVTYTADERDRGLKDFDGADLTINTEGNYSYIVSEQIPAGAIGYDTKKYVVGIVVVPDGDGLKVEYVWYHELVEDHATQPEILPGGPTFYNTIDTGKDDYYPIIIPTIINKDTGMLNKTDHFAYVIGYPDGTVHPNGQITRAEVATIFFRLLRDEVRDGAFTTSNTYSDVAYGKWYNNPISTMSALGIITGYPDGTFKPDKPITRAEFAAIAARFDETQSGKSATFSDVIGHWAAKEIGIAYYNDWIKGYPDGTFKPDQNITRAEAMTLINRVLERKPESPADLLTNMNKWTDNMDTSKWYYLDVQEATNSHGYTRKTFNYELWRQMLPDPDWSRYER